MRDLTVKKSLLAVLVVFAAMIMFGGVVGVLALGRSNENAQRLQEIASQEILANDGYKDSTRTRAALTRAYAALKERNDLATRDSALGSAQRTLDRADAETRDFASASRFVGQDDALKQQLVDSSNALAATLKKAFDALQRGDTDAYVAINDRDITLAGQAYSANVEKFQNLASALAKDSAARNAREYGWIVAMVLTGVALALALIVATHFALRTIVIGPLQQASKLLDRIAGNDLTASIPEGSKSEIGQLFSAMSRKSSTSPMGMLPARSLGQLII